MNWHGWDFQLPMTNGSVIQSESLENLLTEYFPGTFSQWVADNVDHNVATLDALGIIAVSTPQNGTQLITNSRVIKRQKRMKVTELVKDRGVPIIQYVSPLERGLSSVTFMNYKFHTLCRAMKNYKDLGGTGDTRD
jgi:hypothetical protein